MYSLQRTGFLAQKWYFDCKADSGEVFIATWSKVDWLYFKTANASYRFWGGEDVELKTSRNEYSEPEKNSSHVNLKMDSLGISGNWEKISDKHTRLLYNASDGAIRWECLQPRSKVTLQIGGKKISGTGYVEKHIYTIKPWELQVNELRWGRVHTPADTYLWIEWTGPFRQSLLLKNGMPCSLDFIDESKLVSGSDLIEFNKPSVIHVNPIVDSDYTFPLNKLFVPKKYRDIVETERCGSAVCKTSSGSKPGFVIQRYTRFG